MKHWIVACTLCFCAAAALSVNAAQSQAPAVTQDSINSVIKLANAGDARAENIVGTWYYTGENLPKDYERAFKWWGRSAKKGNALAVGNMGLCYQTGNGVSADSVMAMKFYKRSMQLGNTALMTQQIKLAESGKVFSAMFVSDCYLNGVGVGKDNEKSLHYLEIAANKGSKAAVDQIGVRLLSAGKDAEAAKWFKKGLDGGDLKSSYYYGKLLLDGRGVSRDAARGFDYILQAARDGFPMAQYVVGECYLNGNGVTANTENAYNWILKAAGNGVAKAQLAVGIAYAQGKDLAPNYQQALLWLTKCADNGYARRVAGLFKEDDESGLRATPFFNYILGMNYLLNERNFAKALDEFKIVGKSKNIAAKTMEGIIMADPAYAKHNAKKAVKLLKDAGKSDPVAMLELGKIYETGAGVDKDMDSAIKMFTDASEAGFAEAQCYLADMYFEGRGVAQNYTLAVDLYRKAASQGQLTENAANRLAICYENGYGGLQVDKAKAEEILAGKYEVRTADLLKAIAK